MYICVCVCVEGELLRVIEYSSTINFRVTDHPVPLLFVTPLLLEKTDG